MATYSAIFSISSSRKRLCQLPSAAGVSYLCQTDTAVRIRTYVDILLDKAIFDGWNQQHQAQMFRTGALALV